MTWIESSSVLLQRSRLENLLNGYASAITHHRAVEDNSARARSSGFASLLGGFGVAREEWRASQTTTAEEFNLLEALDVANEETRYSRLLAWLLDRRLEKFGTHAQGRIGFGLFLAEMNLPTKWAEEDYWVRLEQAGDMSRVDVEVAARSHFVIHIENKIHSAEGVDQTHREWADLRRRAASLGINPADAVHGIFVTLDGRRPENDDFKAVSWSRIALVFQKFAEQAQAPDVKLFAAHCERSLRELSVEALDEGRGLERDEE